MIRGMSTPGPRFPRGSIGLLLLGVALLLGLDYAVVWWLDSGRPEHWPAYRLLLDNTAQTLGDGFVVGSAGALLWLLGYGFSRPRWEHGGRFVIGAVLLAGFWSQALKLLIGRPRPRLFILEHHVWPSGPLLLRSWDSFPSGHSMTVFAVAPVLMAVFPRAARAILVAAFLIACGRVYGGDHFPTDILCGGWLGWRLGQYVVARWRTEVGDAV